MEMTYQWNSHANSHTMVEFLKKLPSDSRLSESLAQKPEKFLLIYDKRLAKKVSKGTSV
jgi:hypothetical protein